MPSRTKKGVKAVKNNHCISLNEFLTRKSRTFEEMVDEVLFGDSPAFALCDEMCEVEPDRICPHGCPSFMRAAGMT
jgi:hypothetical protein